MRKAASLLQRWPWFTKLAALGIVIVLGGLVGWQTEGVTGHKPAIHHVTAAGASPSPSPSPGPSPSAPPAASPAPATSTAAPVVPGGPAAPPAPVPPPPASDVLSSSTIVYVNGPAPLQVYSAPDTARPSMQLPGQNTIQQPAAFLVTQQQPGWFQVVLPVKPNGSTGWVPATAVQTASTDDYLLVSVSRFALYHYSKGQLVQSFRVAVGRPSTPTPLGLFYIWGSQAVSSAPYTPGIFALSGFTVQPVPGFIGARVGLHGWTDASVMGEQVSNGCVRVATAEMNQILTHFILGTPVRIVA
ncbi:MAG TPA: L,D-transpeptidase [Actinomycetota bacterium]|nr:L,D-transpeptidase [Actinomycetota bacterium]